MNKNEIISKIVKNYFQIDESIGSFIISKDENGKLTLNNELIQFCQKILNDIENKTYIANKSSISKKYVGNYANAYVLKYQNVLDWLDCLQVFIIENDDNLTGLSFSDVDSLSTTTHNNGKYKYLTSAIALYNVDKNNLLEDTILHEMKHLFISLYDNYKEKKYSNYDLNAYDYYKNIIINIDFSKIDHSYIDIHINEPKFAKSALYRMLYNLNDYEVEAYKENINNEIRKAIEANKNISLENLIERNHEMLKAYDNMKYVLQKIDKHMKSLNSEIFISDFRVIFNTHENKSTNCNFIINKFISKINHIYKNIKKQYEFWRCYYNDK